MHCLAVFTAAGCVPPQPALPRVLPVRLCQPTANRPPLGPPLMQIKDRFEFPMQLDMYPYTVEGADEADGRVSRADAVRAV